MKKLIIVLALLAYSSSARAQDFVPPDKDLWEAMKNALSEVEASVKAHQRIANIVQSVEREAQARAARQKPAPTEKK